MFELLSKSLEDRDYFGAASLLSSLRELFPAIDINGPGFRDAQIRFVPLDRLLHIFISVSSILDYEEFPGDESEPTVSDSGHLLHSKRLYVNPAKHLADTMPLYLDGCVIHCLHLEEEL